MIVFSSATALMRSLLLVLTGLFCVTLIAMIPVVLTAESARGDENAASAPGDQTDVSEPPANPFPDAVTVPDGIFDGGVEWLNTSRPIDLKDLRGKVVVVDFWTYCCINCMHVLPDLKYLEEKYADQLVVIGVHSAKFDNEKDSENIRNAVLRYEIQHPVVNDADMTIWRKFGTRAWPTLALIDPEGKYAGSQSGEGNRELFDQVIGKLVEYHRWKGTLDENPIVFQTEAGKVQPTPLRYPGKVSAYGPGNRLFISDSNHNRIVVTTLTGELIHVIGTGTAGRTDGSFAVAEFNRPQGTLLVGQQLFVCDTENHLIRVVDLESLTVSTLAGTGIQGIPGVRTSGSRLETPLNSPWSVAHADGMLYIAMAGPHQIWSHEIGSDVIGVYAGSGREDVINGSLRSAAFAQPSEIIADSDGSFLYVVDSEGSAIRRVPTDPAGLVTTVAGTSELPRGQSLFAFGDVDAVGSDARFQHPLGIAADNGILYVADSYNHKIRKITAADGKTETWIGTGVRGASTDPVMLNEPGGLAIADGRLYIADTNNHRILNVDLATGKANAVEIPALIPPTPPRKTAVPDFASAIPLPVQSLAATERVSVRVSVRLPDQHKFNDLAPAVWELFSESEQSVVSNDVLATVQPAEIDESEEQVTLRLNIPLTGAPGEGVYFLRVSFGYCGTDDRALCRLATADWRLPLQLNTDGGTEELELEFPAIVE